MDCHFSKDSPLICTRKPELLSISHDLCHATPTLVTAQHHSRNIDFLFSRRLEPPRKIFRSLNPIDVTFCLMRYTCLASFPWQSQHEFDRYGPGPCTSGTLFGSGTKLQLCFSTCIQWGVWLSQREVQH